MEYTNNDYKLLKDILSIAEYAYRLGVKHGSIVKDPYSIKECAADYHDKKFRMLIDAPDKPLSVNVFCDYVIIWCGRISASSLRDFLRCSVYGGALKTDILVATHLYYRKGLLDGANIDRYKAERFFDAIGHGGQHINIVTGKSRSRNFFFDEYKYNVRILGNEWKEAGAKISMDRFARFLGETWAKRE